MEVIDGGYGLSTSINYRFNGKSSPETIGNHSHGKSLNMENVLYNFPSTNPWNIEIENLRDPTVQPFGVLSNAQATLKYPDDTHFTLAYGNEKGNVALFLKKKTLHDMNLDKKQMT